MNNRAMLFIAAIALALVMAWFVVGNAECRPADKGAALGTVFKLFGC